ncbi:MAG: hypothetical protein Q8N26_22980 [Myxococcales bacterium]|nr:hypothetical protein [Myxococcales bacterium]
MTPMQPGFQSTQAQSELSAPAIGLIVAGFIGALLTLLGIGTNLFTMIGAAGSDLSTLDDPNLPPALKPFLKVASSGVIGLLINLVQGAVNGFIIYAGVQMREARQYGVCVAGASLASIPLCFSSCCCIFTMPLGIWALSVLLGQRGKAQFQPA